MKLALTLAFAASLGMAGAAFAQDVPSGGPTAKGNAPIKHKHSVNDGAPKKGANSFTENQARKHILNSGYTSVTNLAKGSDGVWRGTAMKGGASTSVAMDFKGNVSEGDGAMASSAMTTKSDSSTMATTPPMDTGATTTRTTATGAAVMRHHRHHRMHHHYNCANPAPNGAACSGVDRNDNGISDKEDRALHPK